MKAEIREVELRNDEEVTILKVTVPEPFPPYPYNRESKKKDYQKALTAYEKRLKEYRLLRPGPINIEVIR